MVGNGVSASNHALTPSLIKGGPDIEGSLCLTKFAQRKVSSQTISG